MEELREQLVKATLSWERAFGNAPLITTVLSEYDAANLVGCSLEAYSTSMQGCSAVQKGHDFVFNGLRYQVKGNRPSGKPGSFVTWVPKATNYHWDYLIWILTTRSTRFKKHGNGRLRLMWMHLMRSSACRPLTFDLANDWRRLAPNNSFKPKPNLPPN